MLTSLTRSLAFVEAEMSGKSLSALRDVFARLHDILAYLTEYLYSITKAFRQLLQLYSSKVQSFYSLP
jgi:hypothetical protein